MQRYCAAASTSSQRGAITGRGCATVSRSSPAMAPSGATCRGSMCGTPLNCRGCCGEGRRVGDGPTRVGVSEDRPRNQRSRMTAGAFGCGNPCHHCGAFGRALGRAERTPASKPASTPLGGACAPPRRATRGRSRGEIAMLSPEVGARQPPVLVGEMRRLMAIRGNWPAWQSGRSSGLSGGHRCDHAYSPDPLSFF